MFRKLLLIVLISVFALSNIAIADSKEKKKHYTNGKPFKIIWERLENHEERIANIETKLSTIEGNSAKYTVDFQRCLNSDNSEAAIPYSSGANMSQTLIWNCADYEDYGDQHIEIFFTSDDGQCFKMNRLYVGEGNCDSPYIPPENPVFKANIKDFELTSRVHEVCYNPFNCDYYYYVKYTYRIENTGNTTLFNLTGKVAIYGPTDIDKIYVLPVGESVTETGAIDVGENITAPATYTLTVSLEMWDGTILDSQSKTITVIP